MRIMNNISAMNAHRLYTNNNSKLSKSLEKLSSGYAINRAGDNAAGLAVSEKMRAQIAGLEQASKNAQDGISMVQTYEGALTESDSILQRMRSLAVQSANGSYDNSVDRVAIEQEFKQLNDELNQIADTDFNGVVVLNGGVMADGAVADAKGIIDYTNQPARAAKELTANDINTVDTKAYNGDMNAANALWDNLGLSEDVESVDITFKYNEATDSWSAVDSDNVTAKSNLDGLVVKKGSTTTKNNGGFSVNNAQITAVTTGTDKTLNAADVDADKYEYANVVLDSSKLIDGDTVTITFTRPEITNTAPENIAVKDGTLTVSEGHTIADPALTVNGGGAAATNYVSTNFGTGKVEMTQTAEDAFNGLNDAKFEVTYTASADDTAALTGIKMTLADGTSADIKLGGDSSIASADGVEYSITTTAAGAMTIKDADGKEIAKVTPGAITATGMKKDEVAKASFEIALDEAIFDDSAVPSASIAGSDEYAVSQSNAFNQSTTKLTYNDGMTLQVGARTKDLVDFTFTYDADSIGNLEANLDCSARGLGTDKLSLATQESANAAIDKIDHAINKVSMVRGTFGAIQNRLEHKINNLDTNHENLSAAESRIRDTDMAAEMMEFTKNQILSQASQSMLAQANQLPQGVLSLLQ